MSDVRSARKSKHLYCAMSLLALLLFVAYLALALDRGGWYVVLTVAWLLVAIVDALSALHWRSIESEIKA